MYWLSSEARKATRLAMSSGAIMMSGRVFMKMGPKVWANRSMRAGRSGSSFMTVVTAAG